MNRATACKHTNGFDRFGRCNQCCRMCVCPHPWDAECDCGQPETLPPSLDTPDNPTREDDRKFALVAELHPREAALLVRAWAVGRVVDPVTILHMANTLQQRAALIDGADQ